jgi:hypothetical protein
VPPCYATQYLKVTIHSSFFVSLGHAPFMLEEKGEVTMILVYLIDVPTIVSFSV